MAEGEGRALAGVTPDGSQGVGDGEWFALDEAGTVVRDDAFRVTADPGGGWVVEVAVPRLADLCPEGSWEDAHARSAPWGRERSRMMPLSVVASASLDEGVPRDVLVVEAMVARGGRTLRVTARHGLVAARSIDRQDNAAALGDPDHPLHSAMRVAGEAAAALRAGRTDGVRSLQPLAGSEMLLEVMVLANAGLAEAFASAGVPLLYLTGRPGDGPLSDAPHPNLSAGGRPYAWFTSPLRRYADVVNQRQLDDALRGAPPRRDATAMAEVARELNAAHRAFGYTRSSVRPAAVRIAARLAAAREADDVAVYEGLDARDLDVLLATAPWPGAVSEALAEAARRRFAAHADKPMGVGAIARMALLDAAFSAGLGREVTRRPASGDELARQVMGMWRQSLGWTSNVTILPFRRGTATCIVETGPARARVVGRGTGATTAEARARAFAFALRSLHGRDGGS